MPNRISTQQINSPEVKTNARKRKEIVTRNNLIVLWNFGSKNKKNSYNFIWCLHRRWNSVFKPYCGQFNCLFKKHHLHHVSHGYTFLVKTKHVVWQDASIKILCYETPVLLTKWWFNTPFFKSMNLPLTSFVAVCYFIQASTISETVCFLTRSLPNHFQKSQFLSVQKSTNSWCSCRVSRLAMLVVESTWVPIDGKFRLDSKNGIKR